MPHYDMVFFFYFPESGVAGAKRGTLRVCVRLLDMIPRGNGFFMMIDTT